MKQAQNFLLKQQQVRVTVTLYGRQKSKPEEAAKFLNNLSEEFLKDFGKCARPASIKNLSLTYMPKGKNN